MSYPDYDWIRAEHLGAFFALDDRGTVYTTPMGLDGTRVDEDPTEVDFDAIEDDVAAAIRAVFEAGK